jgi:Spy/CpxP family protein refolding chaperone
MRELIDALGSLRVRGVLLLLAVGVAGGIAGGAIDRVWIVRHDASPADARAEPREPAREEPRRPVEEEREEIPASLRAVDLTDAQRARIVAITRKYRPVADSLMRSVRPRIEALDLRMRQEAMCVLTPRQRDDWVAWRRREHLNVEEGGILMKMVTDHACPAESSASGR